MRDIQHYMREGTLRLASEPPMTRFVAEQLATAHWFDIGAAKRDLGYVPLPPALAQRAIARFGSST